MKQSKDPFEMAFEGQEESPPDSPIAHEDSENQSLNAPRIVDVQEDEDDNIATHPISQSTLKTSTVAAPSSAAKTKEEEEEEEEENMDVELGKFSASGDPDKMAKMQLMSHPLTFLPFYSFNFPHSLAHEDGLNLFLWSFKLAP